jgi:hypothetical protein
MHPRHSKRLLGSILVGVALGVAPLMSVAAQPSATSGISAANGSTRTNCDDNAALCTERADVLNYEGRYTGHDEPSLLFYSNQAGSGNSNVYKLTLPKDPPTKPKQDGSGGTFNFQLHPAFWFGMAMCDSQSYPEYTNNCSPDSDTNIYDNASPAAADYIGHHPGAAFMEMQFYPPGWVNWPAGNSCDPTRWCAALNIDSLSQSLTSVNNDACNNTAGVEYVNFAFITKNGVAQAPADPALVFQPPYAAITPDPSKDLFMNSGDQLVVNMHDTAAGFQVVINDLTAGRTGSMTASTANGFAQLKFDPTATSCTSIPYAFHPMYATSSEHTRVPWAAHSYNVAFSDEIGHFEYCNAADVYGNCTSAGATDPGGVDSDDYGCFNASDSSRIQIAGCLGTDSDFDGPEYSRTWPGSLSNPGQDHRFNPTPILFSSPLFKPSGSSKDDIRNFSRVAFETDLPRIEVFGPPNDCNRTTGVGCVNPPIGASFYPIYTTGEGSDGCTWQLGGPYIPGTTNTFGGNSTAEYGPLELSTYAAANVAGFSQRYNNFRQILSYNPCQADQ